MRPFGTACQMLWLQCRGVRLLCLAKTDAPPNPLSGKDRPPPTQPFVLQRQAPNPTLCLAKTDPNPTLRLAKTEPQPNPVPATLLQPAIAPARPPSLPPPPRAIPDAPSQTPRSCWPHFCCSAATAPAWRWIAPLPRPADKRVWLGCRCGRAAAGRRAPAWGWIAPLPRPADKRVWFGCRCGRAAAGNVGG
eukprot:352195-Chlamydomonas_euryale.AAC.4